MEESVERVKEYLKNFEGDKKDFEAILDVLNGYTESKSDKEIETSDKNVENIETTNNKNKYTYIKEVAEKIVNEYREKYKGEKFCPEPSEQTCMAYEILHLLAEREQDKKRIQELEEENRIYVLEGNRVKLVLYIKENYILKQKVIEALDDIYDYLERLNGPDEDIEYIENKRRELLEDK